MKILSFALLGMATSDFVDTRDYMQSPIMFQDGYTDQPYCVYNSQPEFNEWSCVITGQLAVGEGVAGEHVMSVVSRDDGLTWEGPFDVEVGIPEGLPNAYGNIVHAPKLNLPLGRIYTVYNLNEDNVTMSGRNDELGFFYMKYSDDGARSWSADRYLVPYPDTWVDRQNDFNGTYRIMWTVDHIKVRDGTVYFAFTKIGTYVQNPPQEIYIMSSPNLLHEPDPRFVVWKMLPESDHGIVAPAIFNNVNGTVNEEGHVFPLATSPGFYTMARTENGYLAASSTADPTGVGGWQSETTLAQYWDVSKSSSTAEFEFVPLGNTVDPISGMEFTAGVKSPRGPFTPKMLQPHVDHPEYGDAAANPRYLLIFYNNRAADRNPYFLSAGVEANGKILWSQPEVLIYDREEHGGTSAGGYPDIIQLADGGLRVTSAQKGLDSPCTVRIITIDDTLVGGLLAQHTNGDFPENGSELKLDGSDTTPEKGFAQLKAVTESKQGWAVMMKLKSLEGASEGEALFETANYNPDDSVSGVQVSVTKGDDGNAVTLTVAFSDGNGHSFRQSIDPVCAAMLSSSSDSSGDVDHHVFAFNVDAGPIMVTTMVDGVLCDGGGVDSSGYKWVDENMGGVAAGIGIETSEDYLLGGCVFERSITTSEMVGAYKSMQ